MWVTNFEEQFHAWTQLESPSTSKHLIVGYLVRYILIWNACRKSWNIKFLSRSWFVKQGSKWIEKKVHMTILQNRYVAKIGLLLFPKKSALIHPYLCFKIHTRTSKRFIIVTTGVLKCLWISYLNPAWPETI